MRVIIQVIPPPQVLHEDRCAVANFGFASLVPLAKLVKSMLVSA